MTIQTILFVCTGNICRSPTAEGVLRHHLRHHGFHHISADSAATHRYHIGEAPDPRTQRHAAKRGYDLSSLRARQVSHKDMEQFDLIFAMDSLHLQHLRTLAPNAQNIHLFLPYTGIPTPQDVPDPYYGTPDDFDHVLTLIETAVANLIPQLAL